MCSMALVRYEKVIRPDHPTFQTLRDKIRTLDVENETRTMGRFEEHSSNLQEGSSYLNLEGTSPRLRATSCFESLA